MYLTLIFFLIHIYGGISSDAADAPVQFVDVTEHAGIRFAHISGTPIQRYIVDSMSAGVAFLDYDGDGWLDIYLLNGSRFEGFDCEEVPRNALYRNNGDGTFIDATEEAGVGDTGWGMGCAVGDYDNDGDLDLYLTNYGPNVLYRNNGDGTFTNVAAEVGVDDPRFGAGPGFGDFDNDGDLDLYTANYVVFDIDDPPNQGRWCDYKGFPVYCGPKGLEPEYDLLYRNNGDGTFTDVTSRAGVDKIEGAYGMGIVIGDYDNDGFVDIYVANDSTPNFLYHNNGDGTFEEVGLISGVAYNEDGRTQAGMGTDMADYDNDGFMDIITATFADDTNTLYRNDGDGFFRDVTFVSGVGAETLRNLGYAPGFFDYDNDGYQDLLISNGHVYPQVDGHSDIKYAQRNALFHNNGDGTFEVMSDQAGPGLEVAKASRGMAFGDYDNDGDLDVLIQNINDTPTLLRNDGGDQGNHLTIRAIGTKANRSAIGARVEVTSGGLTQSDEIRSGSSYESQNDLRLHFGLGTNDLVEQIRIRWPGGDVETIQGVPANQSLTIEESTSAWGGRDGERLTTYLLRADKQTP